jgi:hypothetical protein
MVGGVIVLRCLFLRGPSRLRRPARQTDAIASRRHPGSTNRDFSSSNDVRSISRRHCLLAILIADTWHGHRWSDRGLVDPIGRINKSQTLRLPPKAVLPKGALLRL